MANMSENSVDGSQLTWKLLIGPEVLAGIVGSVMDAIIAVDDSQRILLFNTAAERMFGCPASEAIGSSIERFIPPRFLAEHVHVRDFKETVLIGCSMKGYRTLWGLRVNGQEFPIEASTSRFEAGNGNTVLTVVIRDITERYKAEEAMRESEERFRLVADTAPVMIWMSGADKLCNYFSKPWLEFTGRSFAEEAGNGWAKGVHVEDMQQCMNTYTESFDQRKSFRMEYRLRRHDGEFRWILDIGVPRFNHDGTFAGYIGIGVDITERKQLEPILAGIPRKLVEAQEQERARIARDLHDDVGQRLAMLVIEHGLIEENHPELPIEVLNSLHELRQQMADVLRDMQFLCHELHSSRLEYVGLVGAMRSWCREVAERRGVEITFNTDDIKSLAQETSLCLFRVLQEAVLTGPIFCTR
jgi:PAS domain S-box-containing protein